jgi:hypothetical protein
MTHLAAALGRIDGLQLPAQAKDRVRAGNARELFGLDGRG